MKYLPHLLLALFIFSCNPNDNQETEQTNTLIIKEIIDIGENYERHFYFDSNGKLDSITDTNAIPEYNNILSKFEYSNDNTLISAYHTAGTEEVFSNLSYVNSNISNYDYITLGSSTDTPVNISEAFVNYTIDGSFATESEDINVELTFISNNLEYLSQRKRTLDNTSNSTWYLVDYEYDNNFNIISSHTTVNYGSQADYYSTRVYDEKTNPIAESMTNYRLALYFLDDNNLVDMSTNNVISKTNSQNVTSIYNYTYNNDNYPMSATITNTTTNEVTNTLSYIYY
ncbi:hypothetical protein [uncultured Winogradskyella sp.]|uniref:hypothetical protein n=1 Tax=uncultured Winogradskyella sp. TaxID=395353 RepID=UPI00262B14C0|nr:hypothetical protein [uncultured Winogradskyella sp.]